MKIFQVDYKRLSKQVLPTMVRRTVLFAFINAMISPLLSLYNRFLVNRNNNRYRLSITPQVCYLEKLLNDRFDSVSRRIYITDGVFHDTLFIFTESENKDVYIFTESENKDAYIFSNAESGAEGADFVVNVPASLQFDERELIVLLNNYKLASKTFVINRV